MGQSENQASAESIGQPIGDKPNWRDGVNEHPMKRWRKHFNVTLDDLSFSTGLSVASLSRIERYKQTPLIGAAQKIIVASQNALRPDDFFGAP
jgi:DNA-binding XRE family transcriptional regulator